MKSWAEWGRGKKVEDGGCEMCIFVGLGHRLYVNIR